MLRPTLDLSASDKEYTISIEIPGVDEEDVKLDLAHDTLTIRGEKKLEKRKRRETTIAWNGPMVLSSGCSRCPRMPLRNP